MFLFRTRTSRLVQRIPFRQRCLYSTGFEGQAHRPLDLDPSLETLLKDVDISLKNYKATSKPPRELDIVAPNEHEILDPDSLEVLEEEDAVGRDEKKSPAAAFGSRGIGQVVLPLELQNSINVLINEIDKSELRRDATRLFSENGDQEWTAEYNVKYSSRKKEKRFAERDGTAFATIALPAHYSAILAVLDHAKHRLGPNWLVRRIFDFGAATGSALWAASHSFQVSQTDDVESLVISNTTLEAYHCVEKRDGLTAIARRLLSDVNKGGLSLDWHRTFNPEDRIARPLGHDAIAFSAFFLSSLTPAGRKTTLKDMWATGAHTLVILDHSTKDGFSAVSEAREYFLSLGRKELEDPTTADEPLSGCHVVAPCPHDKSCPLYDNGNPSLVCGFRQRLSRAKFIRLTKHSGQGFEDIEYSYVVLQRGQRPSPPLDSKIGRLGSVGLRALDKERPPREILSQTEQETFTTETRDLKTVPFSDIEAQIPHTIESMDATLRREAYNWPRLVFSPLKKSGHIILDGCTTQGEIMRMTIPKSQGKQEFYDARKASWGDIFPHAPKNAPQVRQRPSSSKKKTEVDGNSLKHTQTSDIGKRRQSAKPKDSLSYDTLSTKLKEVSKQRRRERSEKRRQ